MSTFMVRAREVQERQIRGCGSGWSFRRHPRGKSASSRRTVACWHCGGVQLFVEANLERTIHLADLAGRGLSLHHFARAFKTVGWHDAARIRRGASHRTSQAVD